MAKYFTEDDSAYVACMFPDMSPDDDTLSGIDEVDTMAGTNWLTRQLAEKQEQHARKVAFADGPGAANAVHYRIYTEDRANLERIAGTWLTGFTLSRNLTGVYLGTFEQSAVLDYIGTEADGPTVLELARRIADRNDQSEVLVTETRGLTVHHVTR